MTHFRRYRRWGGTPTRRFGCTRFALGEHAGPDVPQSLLVESLRDDSAAVQLAALQALFHFDEVPPEVIKGPARSDGSYLRQTATRLMADKLSTDELDELRRSTDAQTRLASVLALGRQLTVPSIDFLPPAKLPFGNSFGPQIYLNRKVVDLSKLARIGHYTYSAYWNWLVARTSGTSTC